MTTQATQKPRMATLLMQDAENALQDANLLPGSTLMASKKEPGKVNVGHGQHVVTNVYLLETKDGKGKLFFRYEVEVYGIRTPELFSDLTKRSADYRTTNNRNQCGAVLRAFKFRHSAYLGNHLLFYDQSRVLFSTLDLELQQGGYEEEFTLAELQARSLQLDDVFDSYKLKLLGVSDSKKLPNLGDFSHVSEDIGNIDRSLEQFLDIVTAQNVFDDPVNYTHFSSSSIYLLNPAKFGFKDEDCPFFPTTHTFLGIGLDKGIRTVENLTNKDKMSEAVVVSVKKSPFHMVENVSEKVIALLGTNFRSRIRDTEWIKERLEGSLKGIFVTTVHTDPSRRRFFEIHGLSSTNLHTEFIQREGMAKISLFEYYTQTYKITFKYPELPLLVQKYQTTTKNNGIRYFPMEVCEILDNQRVKTAQQDSAMIRVEFMLNLLIILQDMIRKTAIPPAELKKQNTYLKESLLLDGSEYLAGLNIKCKKDPIEVAARVLPPPELEFGGNNKHVPKLPRCSWSDRGHYFASATCNKWVALALTGQQHHDYLSSDEWIEFVKRFRSVLTQRRMNFCDPHVENRKLAGSDLKLIISGYYEQGYEYMLIAHPDNADQVHHAMKAIEQKTEVITQGLKISTVKNVVLRNKFLTLDNIVNKTNVKMGGLNYNIVLPVQSDLSLIYKNDTLIIGIGTNHPMGGMGQESNQSGDPQQGAQPTTSGTGSDNNGNGNGNGNGGNGNDMLPRGSVPSVVGFCANIGKNGPYEFVGDFIYQLAYRDEKVGIIANIIERCVTQFHSVNGHYPVRLIIYRDGTGEGSFHKILKFEVPLIRNVFSNLGTAAKITLIVVNKMQNVRLYAKNINTQAKSSEQNILPGTVVDKDIVHPLWTEFYLNSHVALQGTAKTPRYNLLLDENNLSMDVLQAMTHSLCFGHQIVYSPTSLPTPVMVALEYAKRGRNIYNYANSSGSGGNNNGNNYNDLSYLNDRLTFKGTIFLKNMRINA
ncbi:hypothetical protein Mgra_00002393 [Meloidogyne graminicola]|uniref:Uncharacterized protein n=1 Tax=Meloidogyne graminicola TaxID=189291 RepID=A0A8S9ZX21_9BILA|nr:hypothetical protein Mgra_00002393 [Meloidogyne graminicola]